MRRWILPLVVAFSLPLPLTALGQVGGPRKAVPSLVGLQASDARAALARVGQTFTQAAQGEPTTVASKVGTVARQSPAAGTVVATAAVVTVTLYVPAVVTAPAASDEKGRVQLPKIPAAAVQASDTKGTVQLPVKK